MICSQCGRASAENVRFCVNCGVVMVPSQQQPTEPLNSTRHLMPTQFEDVRGNALLGSTIEGKYRLDEILGMGGMGTVYSAMRLHIGDIVAVKVLHPEKVGDREAAERFRREARAAARLKHSSAVSIYDFGISSDGLMYLVMELVEGHSLRQIIKEHGPMPATAVTEVTGQVCAALDEAHRQQIIHRDIKPDNIIIHSLASGLRVKVLDFGIAKLRDVMASNLTQTGIVMGTPHYMSPEQCLGEELDSRSDIYSFGIVLYEMLCGVVPFNSPTSTAVVVQQVTQPPPSLHTINGSITSTIEGVVLHALEKRREARPQSAGALAQELRVAVYGTQVAQPTVSTHENLAPVATPSVGVPTMVLTTPISGNRPVTPYIISPPLSESAGAGVGPAKKFWPVILGAALLLIAGGTIGMVAWFSKTGSSKDHPEQVETPKREDKSQTKASNELKTNPPAAREMTTANAADGEFSALHGQLVNAALAERPQLMQELTAAEQKYPTDYRFTYDRARLSTTGPEHHEAFHLLYAAGQKAIDNGRADEMLSDLERDRSTDFYRLSKGHSEWAVLEQALRNKDASQLKVVSRH